MVRRASVSSRLVHHRQSLGAIHVTYKKIYARNIFKPTDLFNCRFAQVQDLPETVVSATGIPTDAREVGSSVTVAITEEQIQRDQRRTLPALLVTVPGLNIVQTGGPGGQTSVFMRGTNADHAKVLIDGVDVSDTTGPRRVFDLGAVMTEDIERVEVLRGPQSGLLPR